MPGVITFAFEAKGIGRKDYSSGVELSVEPTIRSYQSVYSEWQTIAVAAGATVIRNIVIPSGYVAIVYDYFATFPTLTLLRLVVETIDDGVVGPVVKESSYGSISKHLAKGFPFLQTIRFTVENLSTVALDVNIGAVGIYTDEEHYYLLVGTQIP
jgi:hypothetical protein